MPIQDAWPNDKVEVLKMHYAAGLAPSQIGAIIGASRNAVIGKLHRLGLCKHAATSRYSEVEAPLSIPPPKPKKAVPGLAAISLGGTVKARKKAAPVPARPVLASIRVNPRKIVVATLESHHCKWPIGNPGTKAFRFCGAPRKDHICPYCADHAAVAYNGLPVKKYQPPSPLRWPGPTPAYRLGELGVELGV